MGTTSKKNKANVSLSPDSTTLICQGDWDLQGINRLKSRLAKITWPSIHEIILDCSEITSLDTSGAWQLNQLINDLRHKSYDVTLQGLNPEQQKLLALVEKQAKLIIASTPPPEENWLTHLGQKTIKGYEQFIDYLAFVGEFASIALRSLKQPDRFYWPYLVRTMELTGYQALPIIALLSFMIGVVLAYQMGVQLHNYGADIFVVDFIGASVLREFGSLLTAIMVAGRSGSAFTAQIGTMKLNEEIDALRTMGLAPTQLLVLPRLVALFIVMPLLTIWANFFGVLGGMLMAQTMLHISPYDFLIRFGHQVTLNSLLIGLGKAPVFALIIASIGCFQGMQVSGSAESVGQRTTKSVVQAIFMIILVDAAFSVIFSKLNL